MTLNLFINNKIHNSEYLVALSHIISPFFLKCLILLRSCLCLNESISISIRPRFLSSYPITKSVLFRDESHKILFNT